MALYGVGLDVTIKRIHVDLKLTISKHPGKSLKHLENIFLRLDPTLSGKLDKKDFQAGLASFGFIPKVTDMQALFMFYDKNKDGRIDYVEFLRSMREPLNERRAKLVEIAWRKLDETNTGVVSFGVLAEYFQAAKCKEPFGKAKTKEELFKEFIGYFSSLSLNEKSGKITKKDFWDYYSDLSVSIAFDQSFSEIIQGTWSISEDESCALKKETLKNFIGNLRYKLMYLSKDIKDERALRACFKDFDSNKSGYITIDELNTLLIKLDMPIEPSNLAAVFTIIDKNKSGFIEFHEFVDFILNDPFA